MTLDSGYWKRWTNSHRVLSDDLDISEGTHDSGPCNDSKDRTGPKALAKRGGCRRDRNKHGTNLAIIVGIVKCYLCSMMKSMTGYGRFEASVLGRACTIEARCVNGRYLEVGTKLPKEWADKELLIRELAREYVTRGSLSLYIRAEETSAAATVTLNASAAQSYVAGLRALQRELGIGGDITLDHLVAYNGIFQPPAAEADAVDAWPELRIAVAGALEALNAMRAKEGAQLAMDFLHRIEIMETTLKTVEQRSLARIPQERDRLRERVRQLVDDAVVDEQRLQLEIVLLSDRLDVSEECVRLRSHIKFFRENLAEGVGVGRKLNFLMQEMNREVNTIGSKSNDAEIAKLVVGMKEELERIREQVQNIE